jgi:hypothetical protein
MGTILNADGNGLGLPHSGSETFYECHVLVYTGDIFAMIPSS